MLTNEQLAAKGIRENDCAKRSWPTVTGWYYVEWSNGAAPAFALWSSDDKAFSVIGSGLRWGDLNFKSFIGPMILPPAVASVGKWNNEELKSLAQRFEKAFDEGDLIACADIANKVKEYGNRYYAARIIILVHSSSARNLLVKFLGGKNSELGIWAQLARQLDSSCDKRTLYHKALKRLDKSLTPEKEAVAAAEKLTEPTVPGTYLAKFKKDRGPWGLKSYPRIIVGVYDGQYDRTVYLPGCGYYHFGAFEWFQGPLSEVQTPPPKPEKPKITKVLEGVDSPVKKERPVVAPKPPGVPLPSKEERDKETNKALEKHQKEISKQIMSAVCSGKRSFYYPVSASSEIAPLRDWVNSQEGYKARRAFDLDWPILKISIVEPGRSSWPRFLRFFGG